jgi:hypothetical protein
LIKILFFGFFNDYLVHLFIDEGENGGIGGRIDDV